jgi:hypothetical protein
MEHMMARLETSEGQPLPSTTTEERQRSAPIRIRVAKGPPSAPPTIPPIIINPYRYQMPQAAIDPLVEPPGLPLRPPALPPLVCAASPALRRHARRRGN